MIIRVARLFAFTTIILCCAAAVALGDGSVFVQGQAKPLIPDQSALITFDGKTERLVIETAAVGAGKEFAWVVPLPSVPKIEAATTGLFPTLRIITSPKVQDYRRLWFVLPAVGLLFGLLLWLAICTGAWGGLTVIFLAISGLAFLATLTAGESSVGATAVNAALANVLDRRIVGAYETATIQGADGKKIAEWLNGNGFQVSDAAQEALDQYAKEGWVFVASRLRRDSAESGRFSPHPLSFTFATPSAVYPMRLTGIENGPVTLDLYVAGSQEAAAAPLTRQRAGRIFFQPPRADADPVFISHDLLQSYCKGFTALTLLSGTLSPKQMRADLYPTWKPLKPFRRVYYMREGAMAVAWRAGAGLFVCFSILAALLRSGLGRSGPIKRESLLAAAVMLLGGLGVLGGLVVIMVSVIMGIAVIFASFCAFLAGAGYTFKFYLVELDMRSGPPPLMPPLWAAAISLLVSVLIGGCVYLALPKLPDANVARLSEGHWYHVVRDSHETLLVQLNQALPEGAAPSLAECRRQAAALVAGWERGVDADDYRNPLTGQPIREEDSPGNYVIELKDARPVFSFFDRYGEKRMLGAIVPKGARPQDPGSPPAE